MEIVEREARRELRRALMGLITGRISEEDFSEALDELYIWDTDDEAVNKFLSLWMSSGNPIEDFRLWRPVTPARFRLNDAAYRRTRAGRRDAARWILFLQTGEPLVYPDTRDARAFWGGVVSALTLGIVRVRGATRAARTDWNVWPFLDTTALEAARRAPRLLCGR